MKKNVWILSNDRGSTLVIGLLTVLLLSLIGVFATRTSRVETQISGNDKAYKEAFYAAEVGLATAETVVETLPNRPALNDGSTPGHYGEDKQGGLDNLTWDDNDSVGIPAQNVPTGLKNVATAPRYTIEQRTFRRDDLTIGIGVPTGVYLFNTTAHGTGSSVTTEVVLRTIYAKRLD